MPPTRRSTGRLVIQRNFGSPTLRDLELFCEEARLLDVEGTAKLEINNNEIAFVYAVVPRAVDAR